MEDELELVCDLSNGAISIVDSDVIVGKFAAHFSSSYTHNDADKEKRLYDEYKTLRATYTEALR